MNTRTHEQQSTLMLAGVYRAIVTNPTDPLNKMRVRLRIPQLFAGDETDWAMPSNPLGLSQIPALGARVWVMFEGGDPKYPVYFGSWVKSGTPALLEGDSAFIPPGSISGTALADFSIGIRKYTDNTHHFDPPAVLSNSPSPGYISWPSFTMVYKGAAYAVIGGNTNQGYVYWLNGATALITSNTLPVLTVNDRIILMNKSGTAVNSQLGRGLDGSIIAAGSTITGVTINAADISIGGSAVGSLSNSYPVNLGVRNPGTSTQSSRSDHIHPRETYWNYVVTDSSGYATVSLPSGLTVIPTSVNVGIMATALGGAGTIPIFAVVDWSSITTTNFKVRVWGGNGGVLVAYVTDAIFISYSISFI